MKSAQIPTYMQLNYIDNCIKQTILWMNGKPRHYNNECCIDFSCCYPNLLTDAARRLTIGDEKLLELHTRRREAINLV